MLANYPRILVGQAHQQRVGIYAKILGIPLPPPVFPRRGVWGHSIELRLGAQVRFGGSVLVLIDEVLGQASARGPATSTRIRRWGASPN
jgi:hypothetical protein